MDAPPRPKLQGCESTTLRIVAPPKLVWPKDAGVRPTEEGTRCATRKTTLSLARVSVMVFDSSSFVVVIKNTCHRPLAQGLSRAAQRVPGFAPRPTWLANSMLSQSLIAIRSLRIKLSACVRRRAPPVPSPSQLRWGIPKSGPTLSRLSPTGVPVVAPAPSSALQVRAKSQRPPDRPSVDQVPRVFDCAPNQSASSLPPNTRSSCWVPLVSPRPGRIPISFVNRLERFAS